ncbi:AIPR family protein [Bacillus thuringiensis]|uniref:AIPR family protein n=1 Tax=Bacillus thuringiensis TaxID=1428 RepID=UPI0008726D31|nr:AIPR family protein [Bacillus thuringiensis]OFC84279.1 AIPR protein [Bacillus thuringiensis]OFC86121.1 AIPR protein [Bacillus thuringiensis]
MKNPIIKGFLKDFKIKYELEEKQIDLIFEEFINYCILNNHVIDSEKNFQELDTGTAKAFDGIAIIVNNKLVLNEEDINILVEQKQVLSVEFIFVQSKTSERFNDANITYFLRHVKNFICSEECEIPEIEKFWELRNIIYENSHLFRKENPKCTMYYATTSPTTQISEDINQTIEHGKAALLDSGYLSDEVRFTTLGVKEIQKLYRKIDSDLEATFKFPKNVTFPYEGEEIKSAYFGLVEINEYMNLLLDSETMGVKNVFDDNIRDYLGIENNEVNKNMHNCLKGSSSQLFGILNNGITIVTDEIKPVGEKFTLHNYQIVNGCQTSNVIFETYDFLDQKNISIPLKIIATTDENTKNEIVKSTNSQTGLKPEQLDALNNFHKMLEEYYRSQHIPFRDLQLYYERRSNQYRNSDIAQTKIINIPKQIKTVTSMFLDNPHGVSGHYGTVARKVKNEIFQEDDKLEPYFVSSVLFYRLEAFFRKNKEYKGFTRMKWHILMAIKYSLVKNGKFSPNLNSTEVQKLANEILKNIKNEDNTSALIINAIDSIKEMIVEEKLEFEDRKLFERKETTDKLKSFLIRNHESLVTN